VPRVLLATFNLLPAGEPGGELLVAALAERGVDASWAVWDDPDVDWAGADLVAVRATWDYQRRCAEFLDWVRSVEQQTPVLNGGAETFAWNADKAYLLDLAPEVPVVPTVLVGSRTLVPDLEAAFERFGSVVVKPRTGASGVGVLVVDGLDDPVLQGLVLPPWVAQPVVGSVRTQGETSVYVVDGRVVAQLHKRPARGEIRVQELYGGATREVPVEPAAAEAALAATVASGRLLGRSLDYARVDLMEHEGRLVVSEVELIEPGLYLDVTGSTAAPFAELVAARV
jgi:glutathione synthase/RimK-type ligase-like ATP-grasp enzyme